MQHKIKNNVTQHLDLNINYILQCLVAQHEFVLMDLQVGLEFKRLN